MKKYQNFAVWQVMHSGALGSHKCAAKASSIKQMEQEHFRLFDHYLAKCIV